jgi:hypothetical protein
MNESFFFYDKDSTGTGLSIQEIISKNKRPFRSKISQIRPHFQRINENIEDGILETKLTNENRDTIKIMDQPGVIFDLIGVPYIGAALEASKSSRAEKSIIQFNLRAIKC